MNNISLFVSCAVVLPSLAVLVPIFCLLLTTAKDNTIDEKTNHKLTDKEYRKCILRKFHEIEKKWKERLNSLPTEFCDESPSMYFGESDLDDTVRKVGKSIFLNNNSGRKFRMDGLLIVSGGLFGGIHMVYNNKHYKLTELEKEWVVLNYNVGIEELFSKRCANLENEIANKMEDLEKKYFSAIGVKV